ncbi:MarR family winged helix-turn-helix transcriptional regulator [Solwaraspora sp. WMMD406]|uniref:helix-turn-helix transcriptional regulator n=1 Tax=Solwaraspora sp. WMMD406 TaxID=3016095 RepID=UPI002416B51F|nr:MarR family winged helix-turn-helix transcriptional regulator [Solwaraspora sp. WMMD406]MDG4764367.1 MarR family winged helix-turn-helix transcriptional regulator [Solwaraspora sp. WMMD406]
MTELASGRTASGRGWTFLTNHAHVLLAIARDPDARLRDVADSVGVTERAAQAIVADLEAGGYLRRSRVGRRNHYTVNPAGRFRHPAEADRRIGDLLALFTGDPALDPQTAPGGRAAPSEQTTTGDR